MAMTKQEIIRLFKDHSPMGIRQLMNDNQYQVSTESLVIGYEDETLEIKDVSLMIFTEDKVWFNDNEGYELEKMNGHFMFSTNPSHTVHPMCKAYDKVNLMLKAFGME